MLTFDSSNKHTLASNKDLGVAKKIINIEIHRDMSARKLWLSQKSYVEKVLDKFDMTNWKVVRPSLVNHFKLSLNQCSKIDAEAKYKSKVLYASVVGCLIYVMACTRSDLTQTIS